MTTDDIQPAEVPEEQRGLTEEMRTPEIVYPTWFLQSKTILFNAISILALIGAYVLESADLLQLDERTLRYVTVAVGVVNVVNLALRTGTNSPLHIGRKYRKGAK